MLVLTRKANQSIMVDKNIKLTVLSVEGDRVSLGIDAPRDVKIFRSELIDDTLRTNKESQDSVFFSSSVLKKKREIDNK